MDKEEFKAAVASFLDRWCEEAEQFQGCPQQYNFEDAGHAILQEADKLYNESVNEVLANANS
jgi:hypothetical protein